MVEEETLMGRKQRARQRRAKVRETKPATIPAFIALQEADLTYSDRTDRVRDEILEALGGESENRWIWIRDITDTWVVYEDEGTGSPNPGCYRVGYTMTDDGDVDLVGPAVPVEAQTVYVPAAPEDAPDTTLEIQPAEAAAVLVGDTIPLVEKALRKDGTIQVKVIEEGEGTSGYYAADMLKRDGPKAFPAGTHMFWNHPSITEAVDRPERDLRDLAATTVADAYWLEAGPAGPALYTDAKVFSEYGPTLEDLAPHIGVSIRAQGRAHDGIIDEIVAAESIDFVTVAGAGGEVVSLFESARGRRQPKKENDVDLTEALAANSTLTTQLTEANQKLSHATVLGDLAASERDRLREAVLLRDARDLCVFAIAEGKYANVPEITKARVVREAAQNPPLTADGALDVAALGVRFDESVKAEIAYLASSTGRGDGTVTGLGETVLNETKVSEAVTEKLDDAFGRLGLDEAARKHAVAGRR